MNHIEEILKVSGIVILSLISIGSIIVYIREEYGNRKEDKKAVDDYEDGHYEGGWDWGEKAVEATVEQAVGPAGRRQNRKKTVEAKSRRGNHREIGRINRRSREIYRVNEV